MRCWSCSFRYMAMRLLGLRVVYEKDLSYLYPLLLKSGTSGSAENLSCWLFVIYIYESIRSRVKYRRRAVLFDTQKRE